MSTFSIFLAWSPVPAAANAIIYELGPDTNLSDGFYFSNNSCLSLVRGGGVKTGLDQGSTLAADGNPLITGHVYDGTHAGHLIFKNGTRLAGLNSCVAANDPGTAPVTDGFHIGSRNGLVFPYSGDISELIVYDSPSAGYRNPVTCYLSKKYNINVSHSCD